MKTLTTKITTILACAFGIAGLAFGCAFAAAAAAGAMVKMDTSKGVIILAIDEEKAPKTAANFLQYAADGFYDGLLFHRVIAGFVVQGGGFEKGMQMRETRLPIFFEETGLLNVKYSISMARTKDPHSATSQFFISLNDNPNLDGFGGAPGYAVFGRVVEGMDIIDAIAAVETTKTADVNGFKDVPVEDIIIIKAEVQQAEAEMSQEQEPMMKDEAQEPMMKDEEQEQKQEQEKEEEQQ